MKRSAKLGLGCVTFGLVLVAPVLIFLAIWQFLSPQRTPATQVSYSDFVALAHVEPQQGPHVESAIFKGREIRFWVRDPKTNTKVVKQTMGPESTSALAQEMAGRGIIVAFEQPDSNVPVIEIFLGVLFLVVGGAGVITYLGFELASVRKELAKTLSESRRLQAELDAAAALGGASTAGG